MKATKERLGELKKRVEFFDTGLIIMYIWLVINLFTKWINPMVVLAVCAVIESTISIIRAKILAMERELYEDIADYPSKKINVDAFKSINDYYAYLNLIALWQNAAEKWRIKHSELVKENKRKESKRYIYRHIYWIVVIIYLVFVQIL